jgi:hypothetical protein
MTAMFFLHYGSGSAHVIYSLHPISNAVGDELQVSIGQVGDSWDAQEPVSLSAYLFDPGHTPGPDCIKKHASSPAIRSG